MTNNLTKDKENIEQAVEKIINKQPKHKMIQQ